MKYFYVPFLFVVAVIYVNHFDGNNPKLMVNLKENKKIERNIASIKPDQKKTQSTWIDEFKKLFTIK